MSARRWSGTLGGRIAMQLAYQFPELAERLVLVSSGGLGPEVSLVLRAAALPGSELWITATARTASWAGAAVGRGLAKVGLRPTPDVAEVARGYASLVDPGRRAAFLATLRSVINVGGQRIDASDRLYLAVGIPVLIVWGARDPIIPVSHGERAHEAIAGSRLEIFDGVAHIPQLEVPARFVAVLERFLEETLRRGRTYSATGGAGPVRSGARTVPRGERAGTVRPRGVARPIPDHHR
jgi:pimeloyl-ACP methyl ester carboxylesterase